MGKLSTIQPNMEDNLAEAMMDLVICYDEPTPEVNPYWYRFDGFTPNPTAGISTEFNRLAKFMGWVDRERQRHKEDAFGSEFSFHFVTGENKLDSWQSLCREVRMDAIPTSITQCKKALKGVHVNLVNMINHRRNPNIPLIIFPTKAAFRDYTKSGRFYPRKAKADGFVSGCLRDVFGSR